MMKVGKPVHDLPHGSGINYKNIPEDEQIQISKLSEANDEMDSLRNAKESNLHMAMSFIQANKKGIIMFLILSLIAYSIYAFYSRYSFEEFYEVEQLREVKELPFCLVLVPSLKYTQQQLLKSIRGQDYRNYITVFGPEDQFNYFSYREKMKSKCVPYSVVMFVNLPLKTGALKYLNQILSRFRAWAVFTQSQKASEVVAFYYRVYELMGDNDFKGTNSHFLAKNNRQVQALSLHELSTEFKKKVQKEKLFSVSEDLYFNFNQNDQAKYTDRTPYTKLLRLSQDFEVNVTTLLRQRSIMKYEAVFTELKPRNMYRAIDRQQLLYLPQGHPIERLEYQDYSSKYKIKEYEGLEKQVRFCVTVLSHNNVQNNRYLKVLMSIIQQKYDNYHIVFIDDNSTDGTMDKTIEYLKSVQFPVDKVQCVQNLQRNFATYNIINAAFNLCGDDDVQMLIDGDDQFIGRYAFQVMNSAYQQDPNLWIAYSNGKTNYYHFGLSISYTFTWQHIFMGRRQAGTFIGPIRTWKVKLIRSIPIANHKFRDIWLRTGYDDSLAHSLVQLARIGRTRYIPEILYEYNTNYGDNDNSNEAKLKLRLDTYTHILSLPVLSQLQSLQDALKDREVEKELNEDRGRKYKKLEL